MKDKIICDHTEGAILKDTLKHLRSVYGPCIDELNVERVVIGIFFTGVKLSNGFGGICFTPIKDIPDAVCCPSSLRAMPSAGRFKKRKVNTVLKEMWGGNPLKKAIGIATINAISTAYWDKEPPVSYTIRKGIDAFDDLDIPVDAYVVVVGALVPVLKVLKNRGKPFGILEMDPATLRDDEIPYYIPEYRGPEEVKKADILVITGTTLINDTLEGLLNHAKTGVHILLVGPTASMLPEAFFSRGIDTIGGIIVRDPDALLDILAEGGSGYHFFGKSADRVVIHNSGNGT